MPSFNADDPKYRSCCCRAHVTTLSRVLISHTLLFYVFFSLTHNPIGITGLLITSLGLGAIYQELRTPLRIYIKLNVLHFIVAVIMSMAPLARYTQNGGLQFVQPCITCRHYTLISFLRTPAVIISIGFFVALLLEILAVLTYWSLLYFIDDREAAERTPILSNVRVDRTTYATASPTVPSAPPFEFYAPPPYEEKGST